MLPFFKAMRTLLVWKTYVGTIVSSATILDTAVPFWLQKLTSIRPGQSLDGRLLAWLWVSMLLIEEWTVSYPSHPQLVVKCHTPSQVDCHWLGSPMPEGKNVGIDFEKCCYVLSFNFQQPIRTNRNQLLVALYLLLNKMLANDIG